VSTIIEQTRPISVLYADDNENDVELARISFKQAQFPIALHHVDNGEDCLGFLRRQGKYREMPLPDLLLLDINMPRKNGFEVLQEIAADPLLCGLPVIVLTTSSANEDIAAMYKLRCNAYVTKPIKFDKFEAVVKSIVDFWFTVVALPDPGLK
jgi:two-component system, chemotaxis family, response regulator Rcp1